MEKNWHFDCPTRPTGQVTFVLLQNLDFFCQQSRFFQKVLRAPQIYQNISKLRLHMVLSSRGAFFEFFIHMTIS